jgi:putative transposase
MFASLPRLFRLVWLFFTGHQAVVLENLALRQQLAVYKRKKPRPRLSRLDRLFWVELATQWKGWRKSLFIVHPDTVVRWQRSRFRTYWAKLSNSPSKKIGRPPLCRQVRELILSITRANPVWRAPRIHGELLKLGIGVSERTVSRILLTVTVPTIRLRVLFVFVVLAHRRRTVLHFAVSEHPISEWVAQQLVEAFGDWDALHHYLIRDRDGNYGFAFRRTVQSLGIHEIITRLAARGRTLSWSA